MRGRPVRVSPSFYLCFRDFYAPLFCFGTADMVRRLYPWEVIINILYGDFPEMICRDHAAVRYHFLWCAGKDRLFSGDAIVRPHIDQTVCLLHHRLLLMAIQMR